VERGYIAFIAHDGKRWSGFSVTEVCKVVEVG